MENDIEYTELSGEIDPTAPQTIRTNGVRLNQMEIPRNTASTFTVNFDNSWSSRLVSTDETQFQWAIPNNYQSQITQLDSALTSGYVIWTGAQGAKEFDRIMKTHGIEVKKEEAFYNFLEHLTLTRD